MGRKAKQRRQSHGSAWYWGLTDCWYYTLPGTKKRVALFDDKGERISGRENESAAEVTLAREKLSWANEAGRHLLENGLLHGSVRTICNAVNGTISCRHRDNSSVWLNDLFRYCGALPVAQFKK
ncbi:hypothetical protein GC163_12935 [bacterium]|nr:hypothetical protein [bacterium]